MGNGSFQVIKTNLQRELLVVLAIVFLALGLYAILEPFLDSLAWSVVLVLSTWPVYRRLVHILPGRAALTAAIMTLGVAVVLLLLVVPLVITFTEELKGSIGTIQVALHDDRLSVPPVIQSLPFIGEPVHEYLNKLLHERARISELWTEYQPLIVQAATSLAAGIAGVLVKILVTLFILFFFYRHGRVIGVELRRAILTIGGPRADHFIDAFRSTVRGTVYGVLLTAVAQGFLAGIGFAISGAPFPVLLGFATLVLSLVPFGPPFLYLPISAWLLFSGSAWWQGLLLAGWGIGVVSMADNVLRPLFISQATNMSVLLVVFSVLGGVLQFGLIGLFLGPVLMALALTLWREWLPGHAHESKTERPD